MINEKLAQKFLLKEPDKYTAARKQYDLATKGREWRQDAACRESKALENEKIRAGRELSFTNASRKKNRYEAEKKVCSQCSVKKQCLTDALAYVMDNSMISGTWGGVAYTDIEKWASNPKLAPSTFKVPREVTYLIKKNILQKKE